MLKVLIWFAVFLFVGQAASFADEWTSEAQQEMSAAGERLKAASSTEERVAALREMEGIAAANPEADDARLLARLLAEKATQEAGPEAMLAAIKELAASGEIKDSETLGSIAAPLFTAIGDMRDNGTLLPAAVIRLNDAIKALDDAAAKANLPNIAEAIEKATGDTQLAAKARSTLSSIAALAKAARDADNLAGMNEAATKKYIDNLVSLVPAGAAGPAVGGPAFVVFRDSLAWNNEMFGEASKGLDLVSNAIATGQFDHAAYAAIEKRLNELAKGPWDSSTASDFLESICKKVPVLGAWCGDAFKAVKSMVSGVDCEAITCDCGNVGGGLMKGPLTVQCRMHEEGLISACESQGTVTGACLPDASGPGAKLR